MKLAMGVYDSPKTQEQPVFYLDHYKSHIAIFGGPMSGKTTFIKTFLVRIHENENLCPDENIYIVDFSGSIGVYGRFNKVCACFDSSNEENIKRIFKTVEKRVEENAKKLGSKNFFNVAEKEPKGCPTHITLIIENVNAFLNDERYSSYQDRLMKFCRDGLSKGLTVIFTANDMSGMAKLISACGQKIVFDMPADNFSEIFNTKVTKPMKLPGRAVINIESECYEFQCFLPFEYEGLEDLLSGYEAAVENDAEPDMKLLGNMNKYIGWRYTGDIDDIKDKFSGYIGQENENRLVSFPECLTLDNICKYSKDMGITASDPDQIVVGLDYNEHKLVSVSIDKNRAIAIYGKRGFGKSNLLYILLSEIWKKRDKTKFIFVDDGRNELLYFFNKYLGEFKDALKNGNISNETEPMYYNNMLDFNKYAAGLREDKTEGKNDILTVFVLQSKALYQTAIVVKELMYKTIPELIGDAEAHNFLFIFSDVRKFADLDFARRFGSQITAAFLLDNVGEFVADKGQNTVFGGLDAKELKAEYARCSIGDGYYFETDVMDEPKKVKFLKAPDIP